MKTAPLFVGSFFLFWGWQTQLLPLAIVLAVLIEAIQLLPWRIEVSNTVFNRLSDITAFAVFLVILLTIIRYPSSQAALMLLKYAPLAVFPLFITQKASTAGKISMSALFWTYRHGPGKNTENAARGFDITFVYLFILTFSAGSANFRDSWYYGILALLVLWSSWLSRNRRYAIRIWIVFATLAAVLGLGIHLGLNSLQTIIEGKTIEFLSGAEEDINAHTRNRTLLGQMGELKLSSKIMFRVITADRDKIPLYLKTAAYNHYSYLPSNNRTLWLAKPTDTRLLSFDSSDKSWEIISWSRDSDMISIKENVGLNTTLLKQPSGLHRISQLPVDGIRQNRLGTLLVKDGPGLVTYQAYYTDEMINESPPDESDLFINEEDETLIEEIFRSLNLDDKSPQKTIQQLKFHFLNSFSYSLKLDSPSSEKTPLEHFLTLSKSGHCEYFATATTLLLRAAGIPARYVIGYMVHEYSDLEGLYLARARDSHAWTIAYYHDQWHIVDTTPPSWVQFGQDQSLLWQRISDFFSWLYLKISEFKFNSIVQFLKKYMWSLLLIILVLLGIVTRKKIKFPFRILMRREKKWQQSKSADLNFSQIEVYLGKKGFRRLPGETLLTFLKKIEDARPHWEDLVTLQSLLKIHYQNRFGPEDAKKETITTFENNIQELIQKWENE